MNALPTVSPATVPTAGAPDTPEARPPRPTRYRWLAAVALLAIAAAGVGIAVLQRPRPAPDVTFVSLSGEKIALKNLRGKVVMVHFWATSCAICVKEMPAMVASYRQYQGRGLAFVGVAMAYDPPNYVLDYVQTRHVPFSVALDVNGALAHAFGDVNQTPTTFVIGKDGTIVQRYVGQPDFAQLHRVLDRALAL